MLRKQKKRFDARKNINNKEKEFDYLRNVNTKTGHRRFSQRKYSNKVCHYGTLKCNRIDDVFFASDGFTVEKVSRLWLDSIRLRVKESTYAKYTAVVQKHILPDLGHYPVHQIQTHFMEQYAHAKTANGRLDQKGGLSSKTVRDILSILNLIFQHARQNEIDTICSFQNIRLKSDYTPARTMTLLEEKRLIAYLLQEIDFSKLGVLLSLFTGLRIGELCALKWSDVSLDEKTLTVHSTLQRVRDLANTAGKTKVIVTEPKSKSSVRKIPIPDQLCKWIMLLKKSEFHPKAYVLSNRIEQYVEPRTMQNRFKRYLHACNLPAYNFHTLRHTFASRCVEADVEIKSLSEILGHSNVQITLDRYVHSSFEFKRSTINRMSEYLAQ